MGEPSWAGEEEVSVHCQLFLHLGAIIHKAAPGHGLQHKPRACSPLLGFNGTAVPTELTARSVSLRSSSLAGWKGRGPVLLNIPLPFLMLKHGEPREGSTAGTSRIGNLREDSKADRAPSCGCYGLETTRTSSFAMPRGTLCKHCFPSSSPILHQALSKKQQKWG